MDRFARANLLEIAILFLTPQNFGGMPENHPKIMKNGAIASF